MNIKDTLSNAYKAIVLVGIIILPFTTVAQSESSIWGDSFEVCNNEIVTYHTDFIPDGGELWYWTSTGTIQGSANSSTIQVKWTMLAGPQEGYLRVYVKKTSGDELVVQRSVIIKSGKGGELPQYVDVCQGTSVTLSVTGHSGPILRWEYSPDNGSSWQSIAHQLPSYTTGAQHTSADRYRMIVKEDCDPAPVASSSARIKLSYRPYVVVQTSVTQCSGAQYGVLGIEVDAGTSGLADHWEKYNANGQWEWASGQAQFEYNISESTTFRAIVNHEVCGVSTPQITLNAGSAVLIPGALVPNTQTVCGNFTNASLQISGQTTSANVAWKWIGPGMQEWQDAGSGTSPIYPAVVESSSETRTYQFQAVVSAGCGQLTVGQASIVLKPVAAALSSSTTICSGEQAAYYPELNNPSASFQWTKTINGNVTNTGPASGNDGIQIIPVNNGSALATVVYHIVPVLNGCNGSAGTYTVNVRKKNADVVTVSGNIGFTQEEYATIVASGALFGAKYVWFDPSGNKLGGDFATKMFRVQGSITNFGYVLSRDTYGCDGLKTWYNIELLNLPVVVSNRSYIFGNESVTLRSTKSFANYKWLNGSGAVVSTNPTYTTNTPGAYLLEVTIGNTTGRSNPFSLISRSAIQDMNYVKENTTQIKGVRDAIMVAQKQIADVSEMTNYFDGLGRPVQQVVKQQSPSYQDLVVPKAYDEWGRDYRKMLPVTKGNTGGFKYDILNEAGETDFYNSGMLMIATDSKPYAEIIFEASPLGRPLKVGNAGVAWQPSGSASNYEDKTLKKKYGFNLLADRVISFKIVGGTVSIAENTFYFDNSLRAEKTFDESNKVIIKFTDKEGRMICKKVQSSNSDQPLAFASTYYLYDDFGNLVVVLPPEGVEKLKANLN